MNSLTKAGQLKAQREYLDHKIKAHAEFDKID